MSVTECGAACLAMIAGYFGRHMRVAEVRDLIGIGRDGASAVDVVRAAESLGLVARAVSVDLGPLRELRLPAIVYWSFNHYLVLENWDGRRAVVTDPAGGRRVLDADEFSQGFTGIALTFRPGPGFRTRPRRRGGGAALFLRAILGLPSRLLWTVLAASLVLQLLVVIPALITKLLVDTVLHGGPPDALTVVGAGAALLVGTDVVATYVRGLLLSHLHTAMDETMMSRFFGHLLSLPYRYFQLRGSGDLLLRLSSHATIREIVSGQTLSLVIDGLFVGVYIGFLLVVAPSFAVLAIVLGGAQCVVVALTFRAMRTYTQRDVGAQAEAQSRAVEVLAGAETIKAMGAEAHAYDSWSRSFGKQLAASLDRRRLDALLDASLTGFRVVAPVVILLFGAREVMAGRLSAGSMLAMGSLVSALLGPLAGVVGGARQLQTVGTHLDRIRDVLDETPERDGGAEPGPGGGEVTVTGAGFRYSGNGPWALRDVTLRVPAGAKVALVGPTGSGKSSLARMLLGLYRPEEGQVHHDGRPLDELDHHALRRRCGVVTQEPSLFGGSIRDNIAFGREGVTLEDVERSARRARVHDEIASMPMGYETVLDEKGAGLSGGQRQRIALARALVHEPTLLLLDEATSHLDVVTERQVDDVLSGLSCTRIVIAHRLSTVVNADLIAVLDHGRLVELGSHDELLRRGGAYRTLVADQLSVRDVPAA